VKNMMVANYQPHGRVSREHLMKLLDTQVENSLVLGWKPCDIIVVANFFYCDHGVEAIEGTLNEGCLRGSKVFALDMLVREGLVGESTVIWTHDLDAWQNHWFACPEFADVGAAEYSRPKFNGGSVFYRHSARDIIASVVSRLRKTNAEKEEPTLNRIFRSDQFRHRVTTLNHTYNVGCSGFVERYERSEKPVLVSHMHPTNRIAWDTHVNDRNELGRRAMSPRLVELLVRRFHDGVPPPKLKRNGAKST